MEYEADECEEERINLLRYYCAGCKRGEADLIYVPKKDGAFLVCWECALEEDLKGSFYQI